MVKPCRVGLFGSRQLQALILKPHRSKGGTVFAGWCQTLREATKEKKKKILKNVHTACRNAFFPPPPPLLSGREQFQQGSQLVGCLQTEALAAEQHRQD